MEKLINNIKKELKDIEEQGLSSSNLETAYKLTDILKNIKEINKMEEKGRYMDYREDSYRGGHYRDDYRDKGRDFVRRYRDDNGYGRYDRMIPPYRGNDYRMRDKMERIMEGVDMYEYGKERYMHGDNDERLYDGLEKLMYALCVFIESTMEFAETPQEKEIIRKHIQKLQDI